MSTLTTHLDQLRHDNAALATITTDRQRIARIRDHIADTYRELPTAWQLLHDAQPGYPTGGNDGPRGRGGHSDRTATLATTTRPDAAQRALDELATQLDRLHRHANAAATTSGPDQTRHVTACSQAAARALAATHAWQPPTRRWRQALATEAARHAPPDGCRSHARVGTWEPRQRGDLCAWCHGVKQAIGRRGDLPIWLVDKRASGRRIVQSDIARARTEMRKA